MSLGFIIGESKATFVTAITSRALSVGEYIKIKTDEGEILGLVERSSVSSAAFTDVRNFDEAEESIEIAEINKRDKTFTAHIGILGFLENCVITNHTLFKSLVIFLNDLLYLFILVLANII